MRVSCDSGGIALAARAVRDGGLIIFPTDTVYGMGCSPFEPAAVDGIFRAKRRARSKPLPILGHSKAALDEIAELGGINATLGSRFWPGPLTIVVRIRDPRLRLLPGTDETIAVRVPGNDCALSILAACGLLVGTSANISGQAPFTDPAGRPGQFPDVSVFVDGGRTGGAAESTIVKVQGGQVVVLREGAISREEVMAAL